MRNRCNALYFGSNTKMSKTDFETLEFIKELRETTLNLWDKPIKLFIIPSFTVLERASNLLKDTPILLGAQNIGYEQRGAFTGEISPLSLIENGVKIAEIGHSERRHLFLETNNDIRRKIDQALKNELQPLLCIGESEYEKETGFSDEVLSIQLKEALANVSSAQAESLLIAYEPVWAIGANGTCADPSYVEKRHAHIKRVLADLFGESIGSDIPILYGGSVNKENISGLIKQKNVNGLFVGRSAWSAQGYADLATMACKEYQTK